MEPRVRASRRVQAALAAVSDQDPIIASTTRSGCWECTQLLNGYLHACDCCCDLSTQRPDDALVLFYMCCVQPWCCWARHRERVSYVAVLTRSHLAHTEEKLPIWRACCCCSSGVGVPKTQVMRLSEVSDIRRAGCRVCTRIDVYGRNPATGAPKLDMSLSSCVVNVDEFDAALTGAVGNAVQPTGWAK